MKFITNLFIMMLMLVSFSATSQSIADISVSGKALAVTTVDGAVSYIQTVTKVLPDVALYGKDYSGKTVKIKYTDVLAKTAATQTLTLSGNLSDGDTIVIGTKNYIAQATLTDVNGHFHIGASASATIDNLIYAINNSGGIEGTDYAAASVRDVNVTAAAGAGDTMDVTAKLRGTAANTIATTETSSTAAWGAATLTGGSNNGTPDLLVVAAAWTAAQ